MPPALTRARMLDRMLAADPTYDGVFITGVVSTGIYCLPSCRARKPKPQNVEFYPGPREALAAGLRACRRCRPDEYHAGRFPDEERLSALSGRPVSDWPSVGELARALEVGPSKLHELFREHFHQTPAEWLARRRVEEARALLLSEPERTIAGIAFEVGFGSLSTFGAQFRRLSALTPHAYRSLPDSAQFRLTLPGDYPARRVLLDLGRDPHASTARVEGQRLTFSLDLGNGPDCIDGPGWAQVDLNPGAARVTLPGAAGPGAARVHRALLRVLGLESSPTRFQVAAQALPGWSPLVKDAPGLRLPLTPSRFDGLVWAVLGQGVGFAQACCLRRRLLECLGPALPCGLYPLPQPAQVAALSPDTLRGLGLTRARASSLQALAAAVAAGRLDLDRLAQSPWPQVERALLALPGFGPWSAGYALLRAFGAADAWPTGDAALARSWQTRRGLPRRPTATELTAACAPLRPHRALAAFYLWQADRTAGPDWSRP